MGQVTTKTGRKGADRVTLRSLAVLAGVAPSTVYRALAGKEGVGERTRERLRRLAKEIGMDIDVSSLSESGSAEPTGFGVQSQDSAAPELQGRPSDEHHIPAATLPLSITLIIDSRNNPFLADLVDNPFYIELLAGIYDASRALGYRLSVQLISREDDLLALFRHELPEVDWGRTLARWQKELAAADRSLERERTGSDSGDLRDVSDFTPAAADRRRTLGGSWGRGVVWLGYQPVAAYLPWVPVFAHLGIPVVLCDHFVNNLRCDAVVSDNVGGARQVARYVAEQGHQRVAILRQKLLSAAAWERTLGFQAALQEHGLAADQVIVIDADPTFDGGYAVLPQARETGATAILCGNDMMALGVIRRAAEMHIDVPTQLSVTGFDDLATSARMTPALTTVRVDQRAIGREALRRIWLQTQSTLPYTRSDGPVRVVVPTELVIRETVSHSPA